MMVVVSIGLSVSIVVGITLLMFFEKIDGLPEVMSAYYKDGFNIQLLIVMRVQNYSVFRTNSRHLDQT